jgi:hypothetical protein
MQPMRWPNMHPWGPIFFPWGGVGWGCKVQFLIKNFMFPTMFPMCFQHVPKDVQCHSHHVPQDVSIGSQCYSQHVPHVPKVLPIAQHFIQYLFGQSWTHITYKGVPKRTTPILPLWGSTQSFKKKNIVLSQSKWLLAHIITLFFLRKTTTLGASPPPKIK